MSRVGSGSFSACYGRAGCTDLICDTLESLADNMPAMYMTMAYTLL